MTEGDLPPDDPEWDNFPSGEDANDSLACWKFVQERLRGRKGVEVTGKPGRKWMRICVLGTELDYEAVKEIARQWRQAPAKRIIVHWKNRDGEPIKSEELIRTKE